MTDTPSRKDQRDTRTSVQTRDDRLKAALKANMARRKAQAKARSAEDARGTTEEKE